MRSSFIDNRADTKQDRIDLLQSNKKLSAKKTAESFFDAYALFAGWLYV